VTEATESSIDAPIVAVAVYADRARITRRGRVRLAGGEHLVLFEPLPLGLQPDSVRVSGRGGATVQGVDVLRRHRARTDDPTAADLEQQRRALAAELAELTDADAVQQQRAGFLTNLSDRAGSTFAHALATGRVDAAGVADLADALTSQLSAVRARQRELAEQRERITDDLAALERRRAQLGQQLHPDRIAAAVSLDVAAAGGEPREIELDLSYVIDGARWESTYDIRLDTGDSAEKGTANTAADTLTLSWFGLVTQRTGEDWPECELLLSTARPSGAVTFPELDPWYLDRLTPMPPPRPMMSQMAGAPPAPGGARGAPMSYETTAADEAPILELAAAFEQGVAASTYRPQRTVAIPADGAPHRTTIAVLDMVATLDYVTAPVRGPEAHLRATVVNSTKHTILAGKAAVFHGGDFVGSTRLDSWAPGEEVELALGVDDRIRVERELTRRNASKTTLREIRRREVEYTITVANHTPRQAQVTVLDQLPVSRDESITVRDLGCEPTPVEHTEMGVMTWALHLAPGETRTIKLGMRVELAKGVEMSGWRE
jgi:uncharacterized protein (TIGR02231 family)